MIQSKLLKVKKWIDLNEAAQRLSIALDETVSAMDLLELSLDGQLILSVKLPIDKKFLVKKITEKHTPMINALKKSFDFENLFFGDNHPKDGEEYLKAENDYIMKSYNLFLKSTSGNELSEAQKSFEYYCNSVCRVEWEYGDIEYLEGNVFELSMLGSEYIDVMWLIQKNKSIEMEDLTNLNGVILRGSDGVLYNLQEKFDDECLKILKASESKEEEKETSLIHKLNKRIKIESSHYFPAGALPAGCELGMSPENLSRFELKLSESDSVYSTGQLMMTLGALLNIVTSSGAKKWTQGDISSLIGDKKLKNLSERMVNGIFSEANKCYKSIG